MEPYSEVFGFALRWTGAFPLPLTVTMIRVPTPAEEAVRDLVRARADVLDDRKRMQQRLGALLLRHGRIGRGDGKWTIAHRRWIAQQVFDEPALNRVVATYRGGLEAREAELAAIEAAWAYQHRPGVGVTLARRQTGATAPTLAQS